ncbi:type II toxin-antitoxin system RelE/ParE family toxin [Mucilaginibacter sp. ZT4R22]|uniref:Type II toxin-antitoxin system RelE/ParE family toxin n=1 Tax=Mucilaginibacter pankratovii TaxID=2772110 RepID=A0ABR7WU68_9SPHI|nr:type II toxin-antitoxin system RelE/ParE family toxin [Mucilaginibacter pankratovii]
MVDYIKQDSVHYAQVEKVRIITAIDKLQGHPLIGKKVPELDDENYREIIFRNYRIIYKVVSDEVLNVVAIHHQSRLLSNNPAFTIDD